MTTIIIGRSYGKTRISTSHLTKQPVAAVKSAGANCLRARILGATNLADIDRLLSEGQAYLKASGRTRKRWEDAAQQRRNELLNGKK